jgi:uroporphyrinogen-III decarboxylase
MGFMTSRERVASVLNRQIPDRVPIDFGAGGQTGIMASTLYKIKKHYGILEKDERIKIIEPYQMLGEVDEKLRKLLGLDVAGVSTMNNMFGFKNEDYKPWMLFDGTPVRVPGLFNTETNREGGIPMYAEGDRRYPPSAVMPKNGFYFDAIIRQNHFNPDGLRPEDNTEEFGPISREELHFFKTQVEAIYRNTDDAIYLTIPGAAFGDVALVPGPFLKDPKGIRDITEWYLSIALRPDYLKRVFEIQSETVLENIKAIYKTVGDQVQVVFMSGTDFGSQQGPMLSEATYRELYLPYQKRLNDWVHQNTPWKTFMHCCGSIEPLIEAIIEAGFDILNPIQFSAKNMDPVLLKKKYGDRLVFWGGGVDTQKTLPFGSPSEVKAGVAKQMQILKKGGGFVFNAVHNVQAGVPAENFAAMMEAYEENREY